jgi:putative sigma-54 modulation protein
MDIIIQSLGFKASENLEEFTREKINKVILESDKVVRANVTLYLASEGNPQNNICEIRLEVPGNDHFVKKGSEKFEQSITECADTLQKILRRSKDKSVSNRHIETQLPE